MPSLTIPQTPRYVPALPTKENRGWYSLKWHHNVSDALSYLVQYADLTIIDLSKAATAEGRAELAVELREALTTHGFCYIINHGYTQAQVKYVQYRFFRVFSLSVQNERMFDIADIPMSGVPEDEKRAYTGDSKKTGIFQGYKPRQYWVDRSMTPAVYYCWSFMNSTSMQACVTNTSTIIVRIQSKMAERN